MQHLPHVRHAGLTEVNATKSTFGLAGVLVIGVILLIPAASTAVHEIRLSQRAHAELTAASQDFDAAAAQRRDLQTKVQLIEQTRSELLAEAAAAAAHPSDGQRYAATGGGPGGSGGAAGKGKPLADPLAEGQKFLNAFPQARAMMLANNNPAVMMQYAPFIRQANLTPAQAEQFQSLMAKSWADNLAITPQGMVLGPNANPTFDQISQVIGDEAAVQFENYYETMTYPYKFTDTAAAGASMAGTPLSDQQNDQLAQIIANNAGPYQIVPGTQGPGNWNAAATAVNWDAAIAQAKATLPPAQFDSVQGALLQLQFEAAAATAQQKPAPVSTSPQPSAP